PEPTTQRASKTPASTDIELDIAGLWKNLLSLEQVYLEDHFFDLGGHSLLATQVISYVRKVYQIELPVRLIFDQPTLQTFCQAIATLKGESSSASGLVNIQQREPGSSVPLSFSQERLWFLQKLEPDSTAYHIPVAVTLKGELDIAALQAALSSVVSRHEILRSIVNDQSEDPEWILLGDLELTVETFDISDASEAEQSRLLANYLSELQGQPFNFLRGPLFQCSLIKCHDAKHILYLNMHHIISDGWSMGTLFKELSAFYKSYTQHQPVSIDSMPIQYGDYAVWQRLLEGDDEFQQHYDYWLKYLADPVVLSLPFDHEPEPGVERRGDLYHFTLPDELVVELEKMAKARGVTLYMILMSGYCLLMHRYSSQHDVCVGTPVAGRQWHEVQPLIGFFVNTVVIRSNVAAELSFDQYLMAFKHDLLNAFTHQVIPFEQIVDALNIVRNTMQPPIFQTLFTFQNQSDIDFSDGFSNLDVESYALAHNTAKYDVSITLEKVDSGIAGALEFDVTRFSSTSISAMAEHYIQLLTLAVESPGVLVEKLTLLSVDACQASIEQQKALAIKLSQSGDLNTPVALVPPRDYWETALFEIWQTLLPTQEFGVLDDFFALGGHSLLAIKLITKIDQQMGLSIALKDIFAHTSIEKIARLLQQIKPNEQQIVAIDRANTIPLTFAQERLWLLYQLQPESPAYNIPSAIQLKGPLNRVALQAALNDMLARHEILRAKIVSGVGSAAIEIMPKSSLGINWVSIESPAEDSGSDVDALISEFSLTPFNLEYDDLVRVMCVALSEELHILCV
ncbi:MAG: hypothetical protein HOM11_05165, partial [Methylococcales bacterium]|nr:hypothetical protein [Methylococcales bacterium]